MAEETLTFPQHEATRLEPHLPPKSPASASVDEHAAPSSIPPLPFVTLTFATSLDSGLSLAPGARTALSGPQSKAMTHFLRSRHDAICVGVGTAIADDPGLNCRLAADASADADANAPASAAVTSRQPRPIIIDPALRWDFTSDSKVMRLARAGRGLAPFIVTSNPAPAPAQRALLEGLGGKYITLLPPSSVDSASASSSPGTSTRSFAWRDVLRAVRAEGLRSIMVEGGAGVINSLLGADGGADLVDSVIVTIAPTWLGRGSVTVSPARRLGADGKPVAAARLAGPVWIPLGEDVVLCGKIAPDRGGTGG